MYTGENCTQDFINLSIYSYNILPHCNCKYNVCKITTLTNKSNINSSKDSNTCNVVDYEYDTLTVTHTQSDIHNRKINLRHYGAKNFVLMPNVIFYIS